MPFILDDLFIGKPNTGLQFFDKDMPFNYKQTNKRANNVSKAGAEQPRAMKSGVEGGHSRTHGQSKQAEASVNSAV
jgi:hypothetical protein